MTLLAQNNNIALRGGLISVADTATSTKAVSTTHEITITTPKVGDVIAAWIAVAAQGALAEPSVPAGFTEINAVNNAGSGGLWLKCFAKVSDGTETSPIVSSTGFVSANSAHAHLLIRDGGSFSPKGNFEDDVTTPDPLNHDLGGSVIALWLTSMAARREVGAPTISVWPNNYLYRLESVQSNIRLGLAWRGPLQAQSEDPSPFTISAESDVCTQTIAVL
jgi:hypothetical protein